MINVFFPIEISTFFYVKYDLLYVAEALDGIVFEVDVVLLLLFLLVCIFLFLLFLLHCFNFYGQQPLTFLLQYIPLLS
jgi:hypothetical protein